MTGKELAAFILAPSVASGATPDVLTPEWVALARRNCGLTTQGLFDLCDSHEQLRADLAAARSLLRDVQQDTVLAKALDNLLVTRDRIELAWSYVNRDVSFVAFDRDGAARESGAGINVRAAINAALASSMTPLPSASSGATTESGKR